MSKLNDSKMASEENEKINFSFNKKSYSDLTKEFLCAKMDPEEDAEIICNLSYITRLQKPRLKSPYKVYVTFSVYLNPKLSKV